MITRIATVAVYVDDQQAAKQFWTEQVGFDLIRETPMGPDSFWLEVAPKGAQSALVIYPKKMMTNWAELKPSIVFECQDIQKTYEEMLARGVKFQEPPKPMAWGTFVHFSDPDGNTFLLKG